jgi:hypothetical protein
MREVAMVVDSARQIRVIVLPESAPSNAEISEIVKKKLGDGWQSRAAYPGQSAGAADRRERVHRRHH